MKYAEKNDKIGGTIEIHVVTNQEKKAVFGNDFVENDSLALPVGRSFRRYNIINRGKLGAIKPGQVYKGEIVGAEISDTPTADGRAKITLDVKITGKVLSERFYFDEKKGKVYRRVYCGTCFEKEEEMPAVTKNAQFRTRDSRALMEVQEIFFGDRLVLRKKIGIVDYNLGSDVVQALKNYPALGDEVPVFVSE